MVLEKTFESSLDCNEIQPVHSEGYQPWVLFGGNDARSEERRVGKEWKQWLTSFWGAPKALQMVIAAMKLKDGYFLEGKL